MIQLPDQRYFRYFDWMSFVLTISLSTVGLLFIFSATYSESHPFSLFLKKQAFGVVSGVCLYLCFSVIDYRILSHGGYVLYRGIIALLIFTLIKGSIGMGAQRWINLFVFKFQPSELAKLFFPAFITTYLLDTNDVPLYTLREFMPALMMLTLSFALIMKQPDLGTGLLLLSSGMILVWVAGLSKKFFLCLALVSIISAPVLWTFLKPYQQKRIAVFLGSGEPSNERYQLEQSKISIGSGGLTGKGLLQGTQNRFMFLPESRTDFIFAVLCEECGFIGALSVLFLYLLLFLRILYVIYNLKNFYAQLLALGLLIHILLATIVNIGMVTGLLPIVGIPLPLMSYGISNLWITFASLGWINGIIIRRRYIGD